ncbi:MAG: type II toxin-antitoxin system HicA family toxin [Bacteroidota bacterium]|nr:type II toxin-antitoxin system HicA family toxin [Bacteroidota bacterium]
MNALEKDGWIREKKRGAIQHFYHPDKEEGKNRIAIHHHPKKTFGISLLESLIIKRAGWDAQDLKRLKLIKRL